MSWFNNLKVARKVMIASIVFILIIIGVAFLGIVSMRNNAESFETFYSDRFIPVNQLNNTRGSLLQLGINMFRVQLAAENGKYDEVKKIIESSKEHAKTYTENWNAYKATKLLEEEQKLVADWEKKVAEPRDIRGIFHEEILAGNLKKSQQLLEQWLIGFKDVSDVTDELITFQQTVGKDLYTSAGQLAQDILFISLIVLGVSILIGVIVTIVLSRAVSRPVNLGLTFAQRIADGDLTERIDLDQDDELGQLGKALNKAAENLEGLVTNVIFASQNLVQAVEQIATGNQNLSQRTSEQASSLEEIASTIEQATAAVNQNAENAEVASEVAEKSSKLAQKGGELVDDAVQSINEINQTSKKIGDIISVINEIAFQTNLLALNASVEAARAGEQGRGFAVVAGEVRNLAQRSGNAAKEISELIKNSLEMIEDGTFKVNESGASLQEIIESIKNVTRVVAEIAESSREQKTGINQINTAVTEMDNMTQQNAALVEETASASEEMSNQARELLEMVQEFKITQNTDIGRSSFSEKHKLIHDISKGEARIGHNLKNDDHKGNIKQKKNLEESHEKRYDNVTSVLENEGFEQF